MADNKRLQRAREIQSIEDEERTLHVCEQSDFDKISSKHTRIILHGAIILGKPIDLRGCHGISIIGEVGSSHLEGLIPVSAVRLPESGSVKEDSE